MARVLSIAGILSALVAAYFIHAAFTMETTVVTAEAPTGFDGVANLQLMHFQMLQMLTGTGSAIVSAVLIVGGEVCDRLESAPPA